MASNNILLLTSRLPFPPVGGDKLKSAKMVEILGKNYNLHLVTISDEILTPEVEEEIKKHTASFQYFYQSPSLCYLKSLQTLYNGRPLQANYYNNPHVKRYLDELAPKMDLLMATLVRIGHYLLPYNVPKVLDIVDSLYLKYNAPNPHVSSLFWRTVYRYERKKLRKFEAQLITRFDQTFFVNEEEANFWKTSGSTDWIPNGVHPELLDYPIIKAKKREIVFFGKMDYQPNVDAVLWFIHYLWPRLADRFQFTIVGTRPSPKIQALPDKYPGITVTGYLDNPYPRLQRALMIINPMQTPGGIQNKLLESMALGKIAITSSLAARSIPGARDRQELLIADTPDTMYTVINQVADNPEQFSSIGPAARKLIQKCYSWDQYEEKLVKLLTPLLEKH